VGDEDRGDAEPLLQVAQLAAHLHAHLGVEVRERLVEEQDLGLRGDRARHRDALLLAAGQLRRAPVGEVRQAHELQRFSTRVAISWRGSRRSSSPKATFLRTVMCGHRA
jgi:hypothetical protein